MTRISDQYHQICNRANELAARCGRSSGSLKIIAVSKTFPVSAVEEALQAGALHLGESYIQEAVTKIQQLGDIPAEWHFIGPVQSNKTRLIAENFAWIHSLDRDRIARRLSDQRPDTLPPLQTILQVNISNDPAKQGVTPDQLPALAELVASLPRLELRGLMTVPALDLEEQELRRQFLQMKELQQQLAEVYPGCNELSMGMSGDMDIAIECGATMVRIGSAIFGARTYN